MSRLEIIISAMLLLSMVFNVVVFVYARGALTRLLSVSEELGDLQVMVDAFAKHVKAVYELEMFYGEPTLQHLMNHAISFNEQLETFEYIYSLTELPELPNEDEEEIDEIDNKEDDEAQS